MVFQSPSSSSTNGEVLSTRLVVPVPTFVVMVMVCKVSFLSLNCPIYFIHYITLDFLLLKLLSTPISSFPEILNFTSPLVEAKLLPPSSSLNKCACYLLLSIISPLLALIKL